MDCEVLTADEEFARRVRQIQDEIQDRKAFVGRNTKGDEELGEHVKNIQKRIRDEMEHDGASDLISKKQRLPLGEPQTETQKRQMLKWQIQGQLEEQARLENKLEAELKSKRPFDEYSFRSIVTNTGEISVRDFLLSVVKSTELEVLPPSGFLSVSNSEFSYRYAGGPSKVTRPKETSPSVEYSLPEKKLFPGDQLSFPDRWRIRLPQGLSISQANATLRWTIYLDDSPPVRGEINLAKQFET